MTTLKYNYPYPVRGESASNVVNPWNKKKKASYIMHRRLSITQIINRVDSLGTPKQISN